MRPTTITYTQQQYDKIVDYFKKSENNSTNDIANHFNIEAKIVRKIIDKYLSIRYGDFEKR